MRRSTTPRMVAWSMAVALTMSLSEQPPRSRTAHSATNCAAVSCESGISAWNPRVWPFRLLVFLGFAAFTLQIVAQIIKTASRLAGHRLPSDVDRHAATHTTDL